MLRRGKRTKICVHILCNTLTCESYDLALPAIIVEDRFGPLDTTVALRYFGVVIYTMHTASTVPIAAICAVRLRGGACESC